MMRILKHLENFLVVCGKHLVSMNISPRKRGILFLLLQNGRDLTLPSRHTKRIRI